jgi:hypothetical protein
MSVTVIRSSLAPIADGLDAAAATNLDVGTVITGTFIKVFRKLSDLPASGDSITFDTTSWMTTALSIWFRAIWMTVLIKLP